MNLKRYKLVGFVVVVSIFSISFDNNKGNIESVSAQPKDVLTKVKDLPKGEQVIQEAITAHGGALYETANYSFVFRGKEYQFKNKGLSFAYQVETVNKEGQEIKDEIVDGILSRKIDGKEVQLSEKDLSRYQGALNSVIYFATLPHKLNDAAVNKTYKGTTIIKKEEYDVVEITFKKEGGGEDHDDEFYYWINSSTRKIDYLAYNYQVNNGGVRFRSSYNRRVVDGVTFQDYVNYKANVGTLLKDLPALYEKGELKELSKIETEKVINLNK